MNKILRVPFLILVIGLLCLVNITFAAVTWVSTSPLPPAYVGIPYSHQLQATSSTLSPITFTVIGGSLPGLSVSASGLITGTATSGGTANVTIEASDGVVAAPVPRSFSISYLSTGIIGPLRIKRLQLQFANNRPEITVPKNQKSPQVSAEISYIGSGLLKGYWTVDGAIHSQVNQTLTSGANLTLPMPNVPPLPTYRTGNHRVQLVITEPNIGTAPVIIYYVTEEDVAIFEPIRIISPADRLEVDYAPLTFVWTMQKDSAAYLIEFFEKKDEKPVFSAYTKRESYTLPGHSLKQYFSEQGKYFWRVKGVGADDSIVNESEMHNFTFK